MSAMGQKLTLKRFYTTSALPAEGAFANGDCCGHSVRRYVYDRHGIVLVRNIGPAAVRRGRDAEGTQTDVDCRDFLTGRIEDRYGAISPVYRFDRDTGGCLPTATVADTALVAVSITDTVP